LDFSFLDIRCKEVVNIVDGRCLGHVTDIIFNMQTCVVLGFVVPASKNFWNVFKSSAEIFIPLSQIRKIGDDTILVELYGANTPTTNAYSASMPATSLQSSGDKK